MKTPLYWKHISFLMLCALIAGLLPAHAHALGDRPVRSFSQNFKVIVTVETPEGLKSGYAVRRIGNAAPLINLPDVGNAASVRGEAVAVDLGERGVLFALISHYSDNEFYNAFPLPGERIGIGGSSERGIAYYATLKPGDRGALNPRFFPGYPKLVTFTDMNDPKSVTLAQKWQQCTAGISEEAEKKCRKHGGAYLVEDRFEELFGAGVKLKDIVFEITEEEVTRGKAEPYLPEFDDEFWAWFKKLKYGDPRRITEANFK